MILTSRATSPSASIALWFGLVWPLGVGLPVYFWGHFAESTARVAWATATCVVAAFGLLPATGEVVKSRTTETEPWGMAFFSLVPLGVYIPLALWFPDAMPALAAVGATQTLMAVATVWSRRRGTVEKEIVDTSVATGDDPSQAPDHHSV